MSSLGQGFKPIRALFIESPVGGYRSWQCRLCQYLYEEPDTTGPMGNPISLSGLLLLVKHCRGHVVH